MSMNRGKLRRGAAWTALGAILSAGSQGVILVLIGFWLQPLEIGNYAVAQIVATFVLAFFPLGQDIAIVQRKLLTIRYVNRALISSVLITTLICLIALLGVAEFAAFPVSLTATLIAISMFMGAADGAYAVVGAIAQQSLRYQLLEINGIVRNLGVLLLGATALLLFRSIELLILSRALFSISCASIMYWKMSKNLPYANPEQDDVPLRNSVAWDMFVKSITNYFSRNADLVAAGPQLSLQAIGIYDFSRRLVAQPRDLLAIVLFRYTFPLFSKSAVIENHAVRDRVFRRGYREVLTAAAYLGLPFFCLLLVIGPNLIVEAFGPEWYAATGVFLVFVTTALFQLLGNGLVVAGLTAFGRSRFVTVFELATLPLRMAVMFGVSFVSVFWVAVANSIFIVGKLMIMQGDLVKHSALTYGDLFIAIRNPVILSFVATSVAFVFQAFLPDFGIGKLIAVGMIYSAACIIMAIILEPKTVASVRSRVRAAI